jgi:LacI family transcriptional regulator
MSKRKSFNKLLEGKQVWVVECIKYANDCTLTNGRREMRVTLEDMARCLGLSRSTISRALNDHPRVSEDTKERVRALAEEMGYIPDEIAKGLRLRETRVLGFITQGFASSYSGDILQGVEETASEMGYSVIVGTSRGSPKVEKELILTFLGRKVDGLIIVPIVSRRNARFYQSLLRQNFPLIFVDRHLPEVKSGYVTTHNHRGAREAVLHLIEQGYRRIACLAGLEAHCFEVEERVRGYNEVLDEYSLPYRRVCGEHNLEGFNNHIHYGYEQTIDILQEDEKPDAIVAINDEIALGAMRACIECGVRVPEDVGIIGFDNLLIDAYLPISLTSIQQPKFEMGSEAATWIIGVRNGLVDGKILEKQLQPRLVVRESTRRK